MKWKLKQVIRAMVKHQMIVDDIILEETNFICWSMTQEQNRLKLQLWFCEICYNFQGCLMIIFTSSLQCTKEHVATQQLVKKNLFEWLEKMCTAHVYLGYKSRYFFGVKEFWGIFTKKVVSKQMTLSKNHLKLLPSFQMDQKHLGNKETKIVTMNFH